MTTKFVTWRPIKNSEREAVHKHGAEWVVKFHLVSTERLLIAPKDNTKADIRWIKPNQVLHQRWEIESIYS